MLIDSYPLEQAVIDSGIAVKGLAELDERGVRGLASPHRAEKGRCGLPLMVTSTNADSTRFQATRIVADKRVPPPGGE
jgi:hypothetical protein